MSSSALEARGVSRAFFRKGRESAQDFYAVRDVNLVLEPGNFTVLKGRSGSGKSTLLNMLSGLLAPSEGEVILDGENLYALDDRALSRVRNAKIGFVPQGQTAIQSLSVVQNVMTPYLMYRDGDGAEARAASLLECFDIAHLMDSYPRELSGGELRRMSIARALMCDPGFILADEPTGDLDDANTEVVLQALRKRADEGCAVLVVSHESAAERFADCVLRMDAGSLSAL